MKWRCIDKFVDVFDLCSSKSSLVYG
uniref:Uncharacterized protein n=1 Tax=Rhizophora mucronata TaxID=61149 RepID=A0A2P2P7M3_RHIMU